jgi:hypothetical protein
MTNYKDIFDDLLRGIERPNNNWCSHILSSKMSDGKYFCPSCGLTSKYPLTHRSNSGGQNG